MSFADRFSGQGSKRTRRTTGTRSIRLAGAPTAGNSFNDRTAALRAQLANAANSTSLSDDERGNAAASLAELDAGRDPFGGSSVQSSIEDGGGAGIAGDLFGGLMNAFGFVESVGASAVNAAVLNPIKQAIGKEGWGERENEGLNVLSSFASGLDLSIFGQDEGFSVAGVGFGDDTVDIMGEDQFIGDGTLGGWDSHFFGLFNLPDAENIARFGASMAVDPLSFLGGTGVKVLGKGGKVTGKAKGLKGQIKGATPLRVSRQSRFEDMGVFRQNYEAMPAELKGAGDWGQNAMREIREGGVNAAIRAARKGDKGFTIKNLEDAGVLTKLNFAGRQVPATEGFVSLLGVLKTGQRRSDAALDAASIWSKAPEKLGRMMEGLKVGAVNDYIKRLASGESKMGVLSEFELFDARLAARAMGNRANNSLLVEMTESARNLMDKSTMTTSNKALDDLADDATKLQRTRAERKVRKTMLNEFTSDVLDTLKKGTNSLEDAFEALRKFADDNEFSVADLTVDNLIPLMNDITVSASDRRLIGPLVFGLKKVDGSALGSARRGEDKISFTISELVGPDGLMRDNAGTIREFMNNVAAVETIEAIATTGRAQLAEGSWKATLNPRAIARELGIDIESANFLLPNTKGMDAESLRKMSDEVFKHINGTLSPSGIAVPVEFQQLMARALDIGPLAKGDTQILALSLARMTETGMKSLTALKKFVEVIGPKGDGGVAYLNAAKKYSSQGVKDFQDDLAISVETAGAGVVKRIRNGWHNPDIARRSEADGFAMFSTNDRAYIAASMEIHPELVNTELKMLGKWMTEWTDAAEQFKKYDEILSKEGAEFAKNLDTWYHHANLTVKMFGGEAVDALEGVVKDKVMPVMSRAEGHELARRVSDLRVDNNKPPIDFNELSITPAGRKRLAEGRGSMTSQRNMFDVGENGVNEGVFTTSMWSEAVIEHSEFLNRLGRAKAANESNQAVLDILSKVSRPFKAMATSMPGFHLRNLQSGLMMNYFVGGVRHLGTGGYRDFGEVFDISRRALRDEAVNLGENGSSPIWQEIVKRKSKHAEPEDLERAQKIAYSGHMTTNQSGGDLLDQRLTLDEVELGESKLDKVLERSIRVADSASARVEGAVSSFGRRVTTGGGDSFVGKVRDGKAGLAESSRESVESLLRGSLMWSSMKKDGFGYELALERVAATHFDYWDLSNMGKKVEALMPFYLFRGRMTQTSLNLMLSTPGMGAQMERLGRYNKDNDPFGDESVTSANPTYTIGAGMFRGLDLFGAVEDVRGVVFDDPVILIDSLFEGDWGGASRKLITENFNPVLGFGYETVTGTRTAYGEVRVDSYEEVQYREGLIPRLAEGMGWADSKLKAVTEVVGVDHPLGSLLKATGNVEIIGDKLYITDNGAKFLGDVVPWLGQMETYMKTIPGMRAKLDPDKKMTQEQYETKISRQVWNRAIGSIGVPVRLVDPTQREAIIRSYEIDLKDFMQSRNDSSDNQDHAGDVLVTSVAEYARRAREARASLGA